MTNTVRHAAVVAALVGVGAAAAPAAHAATPAQAIAALNKQRTANGIPAGIVENAEWSHDCALHNNWMAQNHTLAHAEQPGTPGYTDEGNWAGTHAVVATSTPKGPNFKSPGSNPYLTAPYHLAQLLHPSLSVMGVDESQNFDCETTFSGYNRPHPATDTLYTYPGGTARISWLETARELPSVPGDAVGLPEGTTTGPNLMVYWDGPQSPAPLSDVTAATLSGPNGKKVDTRVVDDRDGLALSGTGFVIPVKPLKPNTLYTGRVTFSTSSGTPRSFTGSWSFKTEKLRTGGRAVKLAVSKAGSSFTVSAVARDHAYDGRRATLYANYGKGIHADPTSMTIGSTYVLLPRPSSGRKLKLTLKVRSFKAGGTKVKGFKVKKTLK